MEHEAEDALRERAKKSKASADQVAQMVLDTGGRNKIDTSHLAAVQVAGWRIFGKDPDSIITAAYDAARFGYPLEETMLYAFCNGTSGLWGTPMVPRLNSRFFKGFGAKSLDRAPDPPRNLSPESRVRQNFFVSPEIRVRDSGGQNLRVYRHSVPPDCSIERRRSIEQFWRSRRTG